MGDYVICKRYKMDNSLDTCEPISRHRNEEEAKRALNKYFNEYINQYQYPVMYKDDDRDCFYIYEWKKNNYAVCNYFGCYSIMNYSGK